MQEVQKYFFQSILASDFQSRRDKNPRYSLRAYANFLDINASSLSAIMKGKRSLPINSAHFISEKLKLDNQAQVEFIDTIIQFRKDKLQRTHKQRKINQCANSTESYFELDEEEYYEVITEWEHYAVLNLLKIKKFELSKESVSKRLSISMERAEYVISNLFNSKLLFEDDHGKPTRSFENINTTNEVPSLALKLAHIDELNLAKEKIYNTPINQRLFTSRTLPINTKKIDEAKRYLEDVKIQLSKLLEDENADEVYNLSINFFPLTTTPDPEL